MHCSACGKEYAGTCSPLSACGKVSAGTCSPPSACGKESAGTCSPPPACGSVFPTQEWAISAYEKTEHWVHSWLTEHTHPSCIQYSAQWKSMDKGGGRRLSLTHSSFTYLQAGQLCTLSTPTLQTSLMGGTFTEHFIGYRSARCGLWLADSFLLFAITVEPQDV